MKVSLRPFEPADLPMYEAWRANIQASGFMSNFFPDCFDGLNTIYPDKCRWEIILVDGRDAGVIWLEIDERDNTLARLGILIGRFEMWSQGFGRRAIELALSTAAGELDVEKVYLNVRRNNARAIACYKAAGFKVLEKGRKVNQQGQVVEFYRMGRDL